MYEIQVYVLSHPHPSLFMRYMHMGKEHVELRVHMYHEPVGTRVTRVNEVCGVDPAGWSAERGPPWVETESDGASAVFPQNRRNGRSGRQSAVSRPLLEYSHDLRSPHTGYRLR